MTIEFDAEITRAQVVKVGENKWSTSMVPCIDVTGKAVAGQRYHVILKYIQPIPDSCPFCRGGAECLEYPAGNSFEWEVQCMDCGAKTDRWDSPELATEQWNRREGVLYSATVTWSRRV